MMGTLKSMVGLVNFKWDEVFYADKVFLKYMIMEFNFFGCSYLSSLKSSE